MPLKTRKRILAKLKIRHMQNADMTPLSMKKDFYSLKKGYTWFEENLTLDQEPDVLMYFSTGLFSKEDEGSYDINRECALELGTIIQQSLDGGCFTNKMSSKSKVKNLAHLRKPVKVSETSFVVDDLQLFNSLSCLCHSLITSNR